MSNEKRLSPGGSEWKWALDRYTILVCIDYDVKYPGQDYEVYVSKNHEGCLSVSCGYDSYDIEYYYFSIEEANSRYNTFNEKYLPILESILIERALNKELKKSKTTKTNGRSL